jgi:hypothetical protein
VNVGEAAEDVEHLVTSECGLRIRPAAKHASIVPRLLCPLKMAAAEESFSGSAFQNRWCSSGGRGSAPGNRFSPTPASSPVAGWRRPAVLPQRALPCVSQRCPVGVAYCDSSQGEEARALVDLTAFVQEEQVHPSRG